jgi:hypothetical protein
MDYFDPQPSVEPWEPAVPDQIEWADEQADDEIYDEPEDGCSCWWGAFAIIGGGTGYDIARHDPACAEHGSAA